MSVMMQRAALTCLAVFLGLARAAEAGDRQTALGGTLALEPASDGTYSLPLPEGAPLPLSFDPGPTGFELTALSFDPREGTLRATLRHGGAEPASAWTVELTTFSEAGEPGAALARTEDWAATADEGAIRRFRATGLVDPIHERGLLYPGQTRRIELAVPLPRDPGAAAPGRAVLSVPVVIYADTSFAGRPRLAREILGARKAAAEELAYWSVRLEEAVRGAGSEVGAREAAQALQREIEEGALHLPPSARAVRATLRNELEAVTRPAEASPGSLRDELLSLSEWVHSELEREAAHVPRSLPEVSPPADGDGADLQERFHEDNDSEDMNCDCGGRIVASVAQTQTQSCNGTARGWQVSESWSYVCRDEDNVVTTSGSGLLSGVGGCIEGVKCFPDKYCPPVFSAISETEDFYYHIWNRTVTNYHLVVGTCTARCIKDETTALTLKCPCDPPRRPGCTIDGCPVLIETGAGGYQLTDLAGGVHFDIDADGEAEHVSWPVAGTDDAWLALDRNGNGAIDDGAELFGDASPQPPSDERNGFAALAVFDEGANGGDGDGRITPADRVWPELLLWLDLDHDGVSEPAELSGLDEAGVVAIELDYRASHHRDRHGNQFRYSAEVWYASGARRPAVDVFLLLDSL